MGSFGFAVRSGIEKVAFDARHVVGMDTPDFFRSVHTLDNPLATFVANPAQRTNLISDLTAFEAAEAARAQGAYGEINKLLGGRELHQLNPGEQELVMGHATAGSAAAQQAARARAQHRYLGSYNPTSAVPAGRFDAYAQDLQARAARTQLENEYFQHYADLAERSGPGKDATGHLKRLGLGAGPAAPVARDPLAMHTEAQAARANAMPGMGGAAATQNAAGGASGFFKKYKGPLLGGAAVLGGGLLLSNLMKKKDENVQGPYGPVYR
jgi:hypothetical protein